MNVRHHQWSRVRFGDVVRQVKTSVDPNADRVERFVAGEHMDSNRYRVARWGNVYETTLGPAFHRLFKPGQVLYGSRRTYLRKVGVPDFEGVCANTTYIAEPKDRATLLPEFLPMVMTTEAFHRHSELQSKGSVNPYVNWSDLETYELLLPPLQEQRQIAELIWSAELVAETSNDAVLTGTHAEIAILREAFDVSSWPTRKVAEAGQVQLGLMREPSVHTGSDLRPYLRVANVGDDELFLDDVLKMNFDEQNFKKYRLQKGDILLNEGQSLELVGRCSIYRDELPECCFQKTLLRFRCGPDLLPEFAYGWFRRCFHLGEFSRVASRTTSMAHLTARIFAEMPIPVPDMDIQRAVIKRVEAARTLRRRLAEHERMSRQLRPHLLNYLLAERL